MTDVTYPQAGGCLCGAVRYEVTAGPKWTAYCHCGSCRRSTGAPVAAFAGFHDRDVRITAGEPAVYESSPRVWRRFCAVCGTPLTYHADRFAGEMHVHAGTFDQPGNFPPRGHVYFAEHVPWFDTADDLKRFPETSG